MKEEEKERIAEKIIIGMRADGWTGHCGYEKLKKYIIKDCLSEEPTSCTHQELIVLPFRMKRLIKIVLRIAERQYETSAQDERLIDIEDIWALREMAAAE